MYLIFIKKLKDKKDFYKKIMTAENTEFWEYNHT